MLSRARRWRNSVLGLGCYAYAGREFNLAADTCDALRKADETAMLLRHLYGEKCKIEQRRIEGFHRDVQNANLMVLREFDRICAERGFVYMLDGGALLGAQRHAGFIPWDDDIDVFMPREHYEKIVNTFNSESRIPFLTAKLVSPSRGSVFIKIEAIGEPMICIDVFPCDCYADTPDQALHQRVGNAHRRIVNQVLPDKNPDATYRYYAAIRNSLGLMPIIHDDPKCRTVICGFDNRERHVLDSKDTFPVGRMDFEGMSVPVPAIPSAILVSKYGKYRRLPIYFKNDFQYDTLTTERMLNLKRFLRSDTLHSVSLPRRRIDATERLRDRFLTRVRSLVSPVFNVITRDTLKEYRVFSRKIIRLRANRVIRSRLNAIAMYSRLIQGEMPAPLAGGLLRQSQIASEEALAGVLRVCKGEGLIFWLWLGSLLGAVRNSAFLHTDSEAALLMPRADYERFRSCCNARSDATGLRAELAFRYGGVVTVVTMAGKPRVVVVPCDSCPDDWDRRNYAKQIANAANRAAAESLRAQNDCEGLYRHFASLRERMGIGLESDKSRSIFPGWDCPELFDKCHVLAARYYGSAAELPFEGRDVPVPADHDIVLTSLYGDYCYKRAEEIAAMTASRT